MTFGTDRGIISLVLRRTAKDNKICASGSVGGARPCQGRGRGFESRLALPKKVSDWIPFFSPKNMNPRRRGVRGLRGHKTLFGRCYWSPRPIAPSRAFFACRKLRRFPFVVCSIFQVTTLRIVFFLLYYYEYEKNKIYDVEGMPDLFIFYGTKY